MNKRIRKKQRRLRELHKQEQFFREKKLLPLSLRKQRLCTKAGYAQAAAEEISGDAVISCRLPGGRLAFILSDGMGKGRKAAAGSRAVVNRLRRDLKGGMSVVRSIREVNRHMIETEPGREDFATVDLTILDPVKRKAKFYKMGAGASFVVRENRVRKIQHPALPVGMVPKLQLTHTLVQLKPGDRIIMVSDGITEADRQDMSGQWLIEFLKARCGSRSACPGEEGALKNPSCPGEGENIENKGISSGNCERDRTAAVPGPRKLAAMILAEAESFYGSRERDDLTVAVICIEEDKAETENFARKLKKIP